MPNKTSLAGCWTIFLGTSAIIGFIVDTIAIISLIGTFKIIGANLPQPQPIPKLNLGGFTLEWRDLTLIILIYVGIALNAMLINVSYWGTPENRWRLFGIVIVPHLFVGLVLFWLLVFTRLFSFSLFLKIAEAWVLMLVSILSCCLFWHDLGGYNFRWFIKRFTPFTEAGDTKDLMFNVILTFVIVVPILALFDIGLYHSTLLNAFMSASLFNVPGFVIFYLIWLGNWHFITTVWHF